MSKIFRLLLQPSSFAGIGLLTQVLPAVVAAPTSAFAWGGVLAAIAAILRDEVPHG